MANQSGNKEKDFVLFEYDPTNERAVKIDFSGNIKLSSGVKGTVLGSKGSSKFTGDINDIEVGGKKALIGWLNADAKVPNISGYSNEPKEKGSQTNKMNF